MISLDGRNRRTVNLLKTIYFDYPEWTICGVGLMPATWLKYGEELEALVLAHPRLFPSYRRPAAGFGHSDNPLYQFGQHVDCWGTVWENLEPGLDSMDVAHPLSDWATLDSYQPPDPWQMDQFGPRRNWAEVERDLQAARARGDLAAGGGLPHGFMYMRLFYLRGFQNLMMDLATEDPRLWKLIEMVEAYNRPIIEKYVSLGAEYMVFGDDLGMQKSLPMRPETWRKFIKPSYDRLLAPCREAEVPVYLHTDGHILEIIPDLIDVGVKVLNPQIRANGLEGLQQMAKGKLALNQDLDRQLFPFASRAEIEDHIAEVYEGLYLPEGGLMLFAECEPDVPLENIETICRTLEELCHPPDLA